MEALSREQALRMEAEGRLNETSKEVEELSVTLFEQAIVLSPSYSLWYTA